MGKQWNNTWELERIRVTRTKLKLSLFIYRYCLIGFYRATNIFIVHCILTLEISINFLTIFIFTIVLFRQLAEVPGAVRLICNLLSIIKMCPSAFRVSSPPGPGGEGAEVKPGPKPSLDRWRCVCKISPRSVKGFGFPLALHIWTDGQTNICTPIYLLFYLLSSIYIKMGVQMFVYLFCPSVCWYVEG